MSSLTATVDVIRSWVRLDIDVSDVAPVPTLTVTRTRLDTGATATVRPYGALLGGLVQPVGGRVVMYDPECPNDVEVQYTATYNSGTSLVRLNSNPGAENGVLTPWTAATAGALAASQTQAQTGFWSFRFTPDGVTANPAWQSEEVPAVVGKSYTVAGQLWSTSTFTWSVGIRWFDSGHNPLSISTFNVALTAGTWTSYSNAATAPANAVFARIYVQANGTPAGANLLYGDQLTISTTINVTVSSAIVIDPSNGYGWLVDPTRPYLNVRLDMARRPLALGFIGGAPGQGVAYLGLGPKNRKAVGQLFDVNNSALPVGIARQRRAPAYDLSLIARSFVDRDNIVTLAQSGSALLLQLPIVYGEPDRYVWPGDFDEGSVMNDQRRQPKAVKLPVTQTSAPVGPMGGTTGERIVDLGTHYSTWGALTAGTSGVYDTCTRTVAAGGAGTADVSPGSAAWTVAGTASDVSVNGSQLLIGLSAVNVPDRVSVGNLADVEAYITVVPPVVALGNVYRAGVLVRNIDANNYYVLHVAFGLAGATTVAVLKRVASVESIPTGGSAAGATYSAAQTWRIHARIAGSALQVSAWPASTLEPDWQVSITDTGLASAASFGLYARADTGNTNTLPISIAFDDLSFSGGLTWQGIMDGAVA